MNVDVFTVRSVVPGYMYFAICVEDQCLEEDFFLTHNNNEHELVFVTPGEQGPSGGLYIYSFLTFKRYFWNTGAGDLRGSYSVNEHITRRTIEMESINAIERYAFIGPIHPGAMNARFNGDIQESPITGVRILERFQKDGFHVYNGVIHFDDPDDEDEDGD